jgi:hypothetical protein
VSNAGSASRNIAILLNDGVWPTVDPTSGDFDSDGDVDGADFLGWQRGASPNAGSAADLEDWQTKFGQMQSAPGAESSANATAELNSPSLQLNDATQAVEMRRASENQRATLARESAFVALTAPVARGRTEIRHILRTSAAASSLEKSRTNSAHLGWLSQADSDRTIVTWSKGKLAEFDQAAHAGDCVLETVDEALAQRIST